MYTELIKLTEGKEPGRLQLAAFHFAMLTKVATVRKNTAHAKQSWISRSQ